MFLLSEPPGANPDPTANAPAGALNAKFGFAAPPNTVVVGALGVNENAVVVAPPKEGVL